MQLPSERTLIKRFARNTAGRDFIAGDLHGHFDKLDAAMAAVSFDATRDRLFLLGDMVDRGPASERVLAYLERPEVHAILGNHEAWLLEHHRGTADLAAYAFHGGAWAIGMTRAERQPYADAFEALPLAIELETEHGLLGLVHANCGTDWPKLAAVLRNPDLIDGADMDALQHALLWDRSRVDCADTSPVAGVLAVVVGHTPVPDFCTLGNHLYADLGVWLPRNRDQPLRLLEASEIRDAGSMAA